MASDFPPLEYFQNFVVAHLRSIVLICIIILSICFRQLAFQFFRYLKEKLERQASVPRSSYFQKFLRLSIERPIAWILIIGVWLLLLEDISDLSVSTERTARAVFQVLLWIQFIRLAYFAADALGDLISDRAAFAEGGDESSLHKQLAPLMTKALKAFAVILGILLILQNVGVNVMSIIAGLGIGGLAIALAAQDTCANLLGSVVIFLDRPFQIGDYIKILDIEGNVVEVGFRSSILRTPTQTLITVPNSMIAREKIENFQLHQRRRMRFALSLSYSSPLDKMAEYRDRTETLLKNHPVVAKDDITVRLTEATPGGMTISIIFFLQAHDTSEELRLQEEILLAILSLSEDVGLTLAYGTPTLLIKRSSDLNQTKNSL